MTVQQGIGLPMTDPVFAQSWKGSVDCGDLRQENIYSKSQNML